MLVFLWNCCFVCCGYTWIRGYSYIRSISILKDLWICRVTPNCHVFWFLHWVKCICVWCESRNWSRTECSHVCEGLVYIAEYRCHCMDTLTPAYREASQFRLFVLGLTCRGWISTSCRVLKHGNIPFNIPGGCWCPRGRKDLSAPGCDVEEIIHAFWSLHQYFYLIRNFLCWTAVEGSKSCSSWDMDSSFTILPSGEWRIAVHLPCLTASSPLAALVEKYHWIMRMKISLHACNIICQDTPSYWVYSKHLNKC